jgi:hypothetical protein
MCAGGVPAPASSASRSRALPNVWPEVGKSYVVGLTFASSVRTSSGLENGWVPASSKQYQTTGQDWGGAASIPASADTRRGRGSGTRPPATTRSAPAKREELTEQAPLRCAAGARARRSALVRTALALRWVPVKIGRHCCCCCCGGGRGERRNDGEHAARGRRRSKPRDRARSLEQTVLLHSSSKGGAIGLVGL